MSDPAQGTGFRATGWYAAMASYPGKGASPEDYQESGLWEPEELREAVGTERGMGGQRSVEIPKSVTG